MSASKERSSVYCGGCGEKVFASLLELTEGSTTRCKSCSEEMNVSDKLNQLIGLMERSNEIGLECVQVNQAAMQMHRVNIALGVRQPAAWFIPQCSHEFSAGLTVNFCLKCGQKQQ